MLNGLPRLPRQRDRGTVRYANRYCGLPEFLGIAILNASGRALLTEVERNSLVAWRVLGDIGKRSKLERLALAAPASRGTRGS
jgi:hypothetical protein